MLEMWTAVTKTESEISYSTVYHTQTILSLAHAIFIVCMLAHMDIATDNIHNLLLILFHWDSPEGAESFTSTWQTHFSSRQVAQQMSFDPSAAPYCG